MSRQNARGCRANACRDCHSCSVAKMAFVLSPCPHPAASDRTRLISLFFHAISLTLRLPSVWTAARGGRDHRQCLAMIGMAGKGLAGPFAPFPLTTIREPFLFHGAPGETSPVTGQNK